MSRIAVALVLVGLLAPGTARAAREARFSGRLVTADAGARTITLEEFGRWTPGSHPIKRVIRLAPTTRVERVGRAPEAAPGQWPGGFTPTPLAANELRPGEFATVTAERHDGKLVAVTITVVAAR